MIVGIGGLTVMVNAGNNAEPRALVTVMTRLLKIPTVEGMPLREPVAVLKIRPGGTLPVILKLAASVEIGIKLYAVPTLAVVGVGALIVGKSKLEKPLNTPPPYVPA